MKKIFEIVGIILACLTFIGAVFGWVVSVEVRISQALDVDERLTSIEEMIRPMLVDFEVKKELVKREKLDHVRPSLDTIKKKVVEDVDSQINTGRARMWEQRR